MSLEIKVEGFRIKERVRNFFRWNFKSGIVSTVLWFAIGASWAIEIFSQFTYKDNWDAGFNAVLAGIFLFFVLLNSWMHDKHIAVYKKICEIDNELIKEITTMAKISVEQTEKFRGFVETETARANEAEKALYDFKADLAKKEMVKRKTRKPVVKKAIKKVVKKKK